MTQDKTQRLDQIETPVVGEPKHGILSRVSQATALAASLTAIVALLFSSQLGITGSLIGAAIGAVVSTLASRAYTSMINQSVEKFQAEQHFEDPDITQELSSIDNTAVRPLPPELQVERDATAPLTGTPIASDALRAEAEKHHRAKLMKWSFVFTVLAALIALGIYAAVVSLATQGQGIGPKTIVRPSEQQTTQQEETKTDEAQDADATEDQAETPAETDVTTDDIQTDTEIAPETQETTTPDQEVAPTETDQSADQGNAEPTESEPVSDGTSGETDGGGEPAPSDSGSGEGETAGPATEG